MHGSVILMINYSGVQSLITFLNCLFFQVEHFGINDIDPYRQSLIFLPSPSQRKLVLFRTKHLRCK